MQGLKLHKTLTKASHPSNMQETKLKTIKTSKKTTIPSALFEFIAEGDESSAFWLKWDVNLTKNTSRSSYRNLQNGDSKSTRIKAPFRLQINMQQKFLTSSEDASLESESLGLQKLEMKENERKWWREGRVFGFSRERGWGREKREMREVGLCVVVVYDHVKCGSMC